MLKNKTKEELEILKKFAKFVIVGLVGTGAYYGIVYYSLSEFSSSDVQASALGFLGNYTIKFTGNKYIVFKDKSPARMYVQIFWYFLMSTTFTWMTYYFTEVLCYSTLKSQIIMAPITGTILYLVSKRIFKH